MSLAALPQVLLPIIFFNLEQQVIAGILNVIAERRARRLSAELEAALTAVPTRRILARAQRARACEDESKMASL